MKIAGREARVVESAVSRPCWFYIREFHAYEVLDENGKWVDGAPKWFPTQAAAEAFAAEHAEQDEVCHCGMLMKDHHQGSSCTAPRSMGAPP